MMYLSILLLAVSLAEMASGGPTFMIKHKTSGNYVHPRDSGVSIPSFDPLVIYYGYHSRMYMTFDIIDGVWGYIRHIDSGKIFHPYYGGMTPSDDTIVVLHGDPQPWAYFAIDQLHNHIIHVGGKYIQPINGELYPDSNTDISLYGDVHEGMEFEFVNPNDPDEIVNPYGKAHIAGEWRLVFSVENPLVKHTETIEVTVGKSHTENTSSSFQFVWEVSASAQFLFAEMSTSSSLSSEIQQSSSDTWNTEITKTDSVEVVAGASVAVWQRDFIGEQHGHKAFHQANMFADTEGPDIKPGETAPIKYRFI